MKLTRYESKKQLLNAGIWSLAVLAVVAVGMMTFFSAASRTTSDGKEKNVTAETQNAAVETQNKDSKSKKTAATEAVTEADTEAGWFGPANPLDTDVVSGNEKLGDDDQKVKDKDEKEKTKSAMEDDGADKVPVSSYPTAENFSCVMPVNGTVTKEFTDDVAVYSLTMNDYRVHNGIDIYAPVGTNVAACAAGTVDRVWDDPFLGKCIEINHGGGIKSSYSNLSPELPRGMEAGATVLAGEVIGGVGETMIIEMADTDHLHFTLSIDGMMVNPLDYMSNYRGQQDTVYEN